jgi:hypothetical protein
MSDQKIYIVSTGCNDDFHQWGFFSTEEKARAAMSLRPHVSWNDIDVFELDDDSECQPECGIGYKVIEVHKVRLKMIWSGEPVAQTFHPTVPADRDPWPNGCEVHIVDRYGGHDDVVCVTSEISPEHAIEVAQQARREWLEANKGRYEYDPDWHLKNRFSE